MHLPLVVVATHIAVFGTWSFLVAIHNYQNNNRTEQLDFSIPFIWTMTLFYIYFSIYVLIALGTFYITPLFLLLHSILVLYDANNISMVYTLKLFTLAQHFTIYM